MSTFDLSVSFPSDGVIRLQSRSLFGNADDPACRHFLERVFQADEISNVVIFGGDSPGRTCAIARGRPHCGMSSSGSSRSCDKARRTASYQRTAGSMRNSMAMPRAMVVR